MAFTEAEIMEFVSQLTKRGNITDLPYTLQELANILEADGADRSIAGMVRDLSTVSREAAELKKFENLTPAEIQTAINRGRERIKREEEARRNAHC
jgi:hypothetical protein